MIRMDANSTRGQPRLLISVDALEHNLRVIRRFVEPNVKICAVVKADAYGHGAMLIADSIKRIEERQPDLRVDQFAVATIDEAAALSRFNKPIMLLRPIENVFLGLNRDMIEVAIRSGWTMTIASASAADDIARLAMQINALASVQIMIDTGMTRCGVPANLFHDTIDHILRLPSLRVTGISTHFVNSEVHGDPLTNQQLRTFEQLTSARPDLANIPKHSANSGAIFFTPRSHLDVVRPGIALYGIDPSCRPSVDRPLRPVMKWTAPIIAIHDVPAGTGVGYNQTWSTPVKTRIGVIPVGYADGYPRIVSNRAVMTLNSEPCGVVGRVSMDMTAINLGNHPDAIIGDEVVILNDNPLAPNSLYNLSKLAETIPYEILTRIGPRVIRAIVEEGAKEMAEDDSSEVE